MAVTLFQQGEHKCLSFTDLVTGDGVQANQFLIVDGTEAALLDPGGDLTYTPLSIEIGKHIKANQLTYVFASHQDPDIIASLPRWLMHTQCKVVTSKLWSRFLPHLASGFVTGKMATSVGGRIVAIPDEGMDIALGQSVIKAVPAHFLHSAGNFHFYDQNARILFSGDMGASMVDSPPVQGVQDFNAHIPLMRGFHQRYMANNRACQLWVERVSRLDIHMLVPQHGSAFVGKAQVQQFLDWIYDLPCGTDLMG